MMGEKDERQFEIEASTMDRQQLYDLAKRKYLVAEELRRELAELREAIKEIQPGWAKNKLR